MHDPSQRDLDELDNGESLSELDLPEDDKALLVAVTHHDDNLVGLPGLVANGRKAARKILWPPESRDQNAYAGHAALACYHQE